MVFFYLGKVPHICGGNEVLECYHYLPANDNWVASGTLSYSHRISGYTHHNELGLVISGDCCGNGTNKVEYTQDGQTIQVLTLTLKYPDICYTKSRQTYKSFLPKFW